MILVVLAAGSGKRISGRPKGMIPAPDGRPLMWHAARNAAPFVDRVLVISGKYVYDNVYAGIDLPYESHRNYFWADAGNAGSLWFALKLVTEGTPFIVCNGDVVTSREAISRLVERAKETGMGVGILPTESLTRSREDYSGIACVYSPEAQQQIRSRVDRLLRSTRDDKQARMDIGHWDAFFLAIRPEWPPQGFQPEHAVTIEPHERVEIDTLDDLFHFYEGRGRGLWEPMFSLKE